MCRLLVILFSLIVSNVCSHAASGLPKLKFLCKYENASVPCVRLARPTTVWSYILRYAPTKWIAVWPNAVTYGGNDPDYGWQFEDSKVNGVQSYDASKDNIETLPPQTPQFDSSFVDRELAEASSWMGWDTKPFLRLIDTKDAYHGDAIFDLWLEASHAEIACKNIEVGYWDEKAGKELPKAERHCVFARLRKNPNSSEIEYCVFETFIDSGIRSSPTCTTVASERSGRRRILSSRYTVYNFAGGDYSGEFTCNMPGSTREEAINFVEPFIRAFVGKSSKYSFANEDSNAPYRAEGVNIEDKKEQMFLRVFLSGYISGDQDKKKSARASFTVNFYYTVSAQSSDDITNYREPTQAMSNRIRNRFEQSLRSAIQNSAPRSFCKLM